MSPTSSGGYSFTALLPDEAATRRLMLDISALIEAGDLITLSGDLGAGKSTFARAFIRHAAGDETIEVPSPTFTLMQSYDLPRYRLLHADLYRIGHADELAELGFDELRDGAVTLLEWPDRAEALLPPDRLDVALTLAPAKGPTVRHVRVTGYGVFAARAERMARIRGFLEANGFAGASRRRIQGDASTRSYERLTRDGTSYILMNSPRRPDGPPVRDGKPYSAIAHLAESVTPFIAMARGLTERGFSAPKIFAADREAGLIVLEDLGSDLVVSGEPPAPIEERYAAATDVLAALHGMELPELLPVEPGLDYQLPGYDMQALLIEAELLLDWYLPKFNATISNAARENFLTHWHDALTPALEAPPTWVLRDYHSPNLLWLPQRDGHRPRRPARLPGRGDGAGRLRRRLAAAGRARRRAGGDGDRAADALLARAPRRRSVVRRRAFRASSMPPWRRSAPPRSSASSRGWRSATTSRNICVTCRAYGPIFAARWRIRRWRRCKAGIACTCRR